ncbi:MAG: 4Fe-4S binding protein [Actinobacteria bacterium]|nr:4Fe-4S binding protein [Actinomycetota bacterium]
MSKDYAFSHDPKRCIKCYTCEIACKQWRGIDPGAFKLRRVYEVTTGSFPQVTRTFHSIACMHCPDAPCIPACSPGAISKNPADGIVRVDASKCNGCRECLEACPFSVPAFDSDGIMHLCDLCADRLAYGKQPICVEACPTHALRWRLSEKGCG